MERRPDTNPGHSPAAPYDLQAFAAAALETGGGVEAVANIMGSSPKAILGMIAFVFSGVQLVTDVG